MNPPERPNLPFEPVSGRPAPPLPDHFEPELHQLDESVEMQLRRDYAAHEPSADLIERIYEASVGGLPVRPKLRLVGTRPIPAARRITRLVTTGRLAAAAAIILAVLISVPFIARQVATNGGGPVATTNGNGLPIMALPAVVPASFALSDELQIVLSESLAKGFDDFSYLVETKDATLDEVNNELLDLFDELESGRIGPGWDAG